MIITLSLIFYATTNALILTLTQDSGALQVSVEVLAYRVEWAVGEIVVGDQEIALARHMRMLHRFPPPGVSHQATRQEF